MVPRPVGFSAVHSSTPDWVVTLTRGPKLWQRRIHMAQPLPCLLQLSGIAEEPLTSTKASAVRRRPLLVITAVIVSPSYSVLTAGSAISSLMPRLRSSFLTAGSIL